MDRRFGVEFEIIPNLPGHSIISAVQKCNEPISDRVQWMKLRSEAEISRWHLKTDSSVSIGRYMSSGGYELCTPALKGDSGLNRMCEVLRMINKHASHRRDQTRPLVDRSTGLHVHVEIKDFNTQQLARLIWLFARFQDAVYGLVARHRRDSHHCRPYAINLQREQLEAATSRQDLIDMVSRGNDPLTGRLRDRRHFPRSNPFTDRTHSLNLTNYVSYGTVEFRLHEGTLNPTEVRDWVCLLLAIVERAAHELKVPDRSKVWTLERLLRLIGWDRKEYKVKFELAQRRLIAWHRYRTGMVPSGFLTDAATTNPSYDVVTAALTVPVPVV